MNEPKNRDFFHEPNIKYDRFVAPEVYEPYQDTKEDLRAEERLREIEAGLSEKSGKAFDDDLGELPFDEKADRRRWNELEEEFDRVFEQV